MVRMRAFCLLVLVSFFTQIGFQDFAYAAETNRINTAIAEAMPNLVQRFNHAESFEDIFAILQTGSKLHPLPNYVTATMKTMLYEMVPSNWVAAEQIAEGACTSGYSWLLKKFGLDDQTADIIANTTRWVIQYNAEACATRVLKKADKLTFPVFASFIPELHWDAKSQQLTIGEDATLNVDKSSGMISVAGTKAIVDPVAFIQSMSNPKKSEKFIAQLNNLKSGVNTPKTASWMKQLIEPEAYAMPIIVVLLLALVVVALAALLYVKLNPSLSMVYYNIRDAANERREKFDQTPLDYQDGDLLSKFLDYASSDQALNTLTEDIKPALTDSPKHWEASSGYKVRRALTYAWMASIQAVGASSKATDRDENIGELNRYIQEDILPRELDEDLLQATYQALVKMEEAVEPKIKLEIAATIDQLLKKKPGVWIENTSPDYSDL